MKGVGMSSVVGGAANLSGAANLVIPEYQGAGGNATGGEGGTVYEVTNLNNSGAGSFREAVTASGTRIVNIMVDGNISLASSIVITNPNLTVNGDTSGGKGICLKDDVVRIRTNNVIFRHLRFRMGDDTLADTDSLSIVRSGGADVGNIIIDHCTITWGNDESIEIWNEDAFTWLENVTVQWCLIADTLDWNLHSKQFIIGPNNRTRNVSVHHNMFISGEERNPWTQGNTGFDYINNVVFNIFGDGKLSLGGITAIDGPISPTKINIINNLELDGPDTSTSGMIRLVLVNNCTDEANEALHEVYISGNKDKDGDEGWALLSACGSGAAAIPADTRFQVNDPHPQPGVPINIDPTDDLVDILVNGTGYNHAGVGACPGGVSGRDSRDVAQLAEAIVSRDSGAGAVDTAIIRKVDTVAEDVPGGYPDLT